ncbi:MAG: P1 family peptidase [Gemmatimonadales bacterium]|nr:P1 family peptidase [Gemmatimonadales bacterium]
MPASVPCRRAPRLALLVLSLLAAPAAAQARARALGIAPGIFAPGPLNALTDVAGVRVGHATVHEGDSVHTGVTVILPHGGNAFLDRVPAALVVGNGFGKFVGVSQVQELGELETPIALTCTLCVWRVADALAAWMLEQPGLERVRSINPVVGETNDGGLNAIRQRPVTAAHVRAALAAAGTGPVEEGSVGAGTGTIAFGWKGGIGTSSRRLPAALGGHTVGVLVQANFGGVLTVLGVPVGQRLGRHAFRDALGAERGDGSIVVVVATDAPLSDRNLRRLAQRALLGVGRTGGTMANGSGDYVLAFSTAPEVRRRVGADLPPRRAGAELENESVSALGTAAIEATEEAIYDALFTATAVSVPGRTVTPLPADTVAAMVRAAGLAR